MLLIHQINYIDCVTIRKMLNFTISNYRIYFVPFKVTETQDKIDIDNKEIGIEFIY